MTGSLVSTITDAFRDDFTGAGGPRTDSSDPTAWEIVQTGPGATVSGGVGTLTIATGTQAGETILRSRKSWLGPVRALFLSDALLSQRIANQEIELRLASKDGLESAGWLFDGTTATTGKIRTANGGTSAADVTLTSALGMATSAGPGIYEVEVAPDEVGCHRLPDTTAGRAATGVKHRRIPDPDTNLFLEIRVRNTATAASSTTVTLDAVLIQDVEELTAEVVAGRGGVAPGSSVPVQVTGGTLTSPGPTQLSAGINNTGTSTARVMSAATTNLTSVKATTARVYGWYLHNSGAAAAFLKLYAKATAPVLATDVPIATIPIPAGGISSGSFPTPLGIATGLAYAITSGVADTDATAVAANQVVGVLAYA
jgi:hypothetical protein